jgi:hypothetical protein
MTIKQELQEIKVAITGAGFKLVKVGSGYILVKDN